MNLYLHAILMIGARPLDQCSLLEEETGTTVHFRKKLNATRGFARHLGFLAPPRPSTLRILVYVSPSRGLQPIAAGGP